MEDFLCSLGYSVLILAILAANWFYQMSKELKNKLEHTESRLRHTEEKYNKLFFEKKKEESVSEETVSEKKKDTQHSTPMLHSYPTDIVSLETKTTKDNSYDTTSDSSSSSSDYSSNSSSSSSSSSSDSSY